jgi:hypothetical protein
MMLEEPRLIRRPLIVVNGELLAPMSGVHRITLALQSSIQAAQNQPKQTGEL